MKSFSNAGGKVERQLTDSASVARWLLVEATPPSDDGVSIAAQSRGGSPENAALQHVCKFLIGPSSNGFRPPLGM
eukprot:m.202973 g.202973  ORF g.202973 m.202973 type:complete len:75 (-) comp25257_c0_seq1:739-963(-)